MNRVDVPLLRRQRRSRKAKRLIPLMTVILALAATWSYVPARVGPARSGSHPEGKVRSNVTFARDPCPEGEYEGGAHSASMPLARLHSSQGPFWTRWFRKDTRPPQAHGERVEGNSLPQANAGGPTHRWGLITSSGMAGDLDDVPSPEDVGRATWTLLHTIAAQMPDVLSFEQQRDASSLISSLARLYPCQSCAKDFQAIIQKTPPRLETKQELTDWLCDAHNVVNQKLGKKTFDCSLAKFRWPGFRCNEKKGENRTSVGCS